MNWRKDYKSAESDKTSMRSTRRIGLWISGLAGLLIVLSASSLIFIANLAWREADRRALESEQLRFSNAITDIHRQIAGDQIDVAHWDATFKALQKPIDRRFIEDELIEYLWEDYGFSRSFIVDYNGTLIARANELEVDLEPVTLAPDTLLFKLAKKTRTAWAEHHRSTDTVFADWYLPQSALVEISQSTFAVIEGSPALFSTVPILPDQGRVGQRPMEPTILINAVHLNEDWINELASQLSFNDLRFFANAPERPHPTNFLIQGPDGKTIGHFRWNHSKPGREIWKTALPLVGLMATIIAIVGIFAATKITRLSRSLEESERRNRHFARHDALTGLPNRHQFTDSLKFALDGLPDRSFAVLACDLDKFKPVNDTFGHEAGDKVICTVAERLKSVINTDGLASRIGGDEFIILITHQTDRDWLQRLADRIRVSIAQPIEIFPGQFVEIGISIGIALAPDAGSAEADIIRAADMALYQAKDNGRNTAKFAKPEEKKIA
ncbi:MAG: diguanylate cyclase [Roseibium sp.]